jgi:hypothetical protein
LRESSAGRPTSFVPLAMALASRLPSGLVLVVDLGHSRVSTQVTEGLAHGLSARGAGVVVVSVSALETGQWQVQRGSSAETMAEEGAELALVPDRHQGIASSGQGLQSALAEAGHPLPRWQESLNGLRQQNQYVVIDGGVLDTSNVTTTMLATHCDAVIAVVAEGSPEDDVHEGASSLAAIGVPFAGVLYVARRR